MDQLQPLTGHKIQTPIGEYHLTWRNILLSVAGLGILATIATVVIGTIVIGGGLLLLLFSPLLLLLSPIIIPTVIIGTLLAGATVLFFGFIAVTISIGVWVYNYVTGKNPPLADKVDKAGEKVRQLTGYANNKTSDLGHYGLKKAGETTDYAQQKVGQVTRTITGSR